MRLQELILENYRGYNQRSAIPLDGRVLLFYGQNGRGKSSVFGALEMALFPGERISELRQEFGTRAPVTNRFNPSAIGRIELRVGGAVAETIVQEVRDQVDEMQPVVSPLHKMIAGQRRRIFFTQELLRDLMLGSSGIRYRRLNEMLGCDAYDRLVTALRRWSHRRSMEIRRLEGVVERVDETFISISAILRDRDMIPVLNGLLQRRFDHNTTDWFTRAVFRHWKDFDEDCHAFLLERLGDGESKNLHRLTESKRILSRVMSVLETYSLEGGALEALRLNSNLLPSNWYSQLAAAYDRRVITQNELILAKNQMVSKRTELQQEDLFINLELQMLENSHSKAVLNNEEAEHAWVVILDEVQKRAGILFGQVVAGEHVLRRLQDLQRHGGEFLAQRPQSLKQVKTLVRHRRSVLHGVRHLYDALVQLAHVELHSRTKLLEPLWKQYYGQITSHSHFQTLEMDVQQESMDEDPIAARFSPYRQTLRFLVSDPDDKKAGEALPMQSLLSEGQLNCAVVALALALSEIQAPPLKVIALDDPFVSWDDVNMENFLAAVRGLAWKEWTIILSTCDMRVVTSFRKNMETLGEDFPSVTYTFRDWDKDRGPRVTIDRVPHRESRHLKDLAPDVFERESL